MPYRRRRVPAGGRRRGDNPIPALLRRRRVVRAVVGLVIALVVVGFGLDRRGVVRGEGSDWDRFDQKPFTVTHVYDGDTVDVAPITGGDGGAVTRVRLIGVDTPEMHDDRTNRPDHWAPEAKRYTTAELEGRQVTVRLEPTQTRDRYDRLLAYLYVTESDHFNLRLVAAGHAYADRRHPHTFRSTFEQAEADARRKRLGLWRDVTDDQQPEWRRRWIEHRGPR